MSDASRGGGRLVVYLDVDGVVTTKAFQERAGRDAIDPAAIALVAGLVRELDAEVVVSSTWRIEDCRATLVAAGLPEGCFHRDWRTAILPTSVDPGTGAMLAAEDARRGEEIADHVRRNGVARYLVLDDVDVGKAHRGRHVRPDAGRGLTAAEATLGADLARAAPKAA